MRGYDMIGACSAVLVLCVSITARAESVSGLTSLPDPQSITGGSPTEPGEFDSVVAILANRELCTGTIVSEKIVLTAAHCLLGLEVGDSIEVLWGPELHPDRRVAVARWGAYPDFCRDCKEDAFDYGFVEIAGEFTGVELMRPIATQAEWDEVMRKGVEVTLVGYGADPTEEDPPSATICTSCGVKRTVTAKISRFSDQGLEFYAGGNDRDTCEGDSGGPAFYRLANGRLRLAGITSRGSNPCGKGGYYGAPYPALCWLEQETGVDLRADGCSACDCIDTTPPPEDEGCRVPADAPASPWSALSVLLLLHRRRRR